MASPEPKTDGTFCSCDMSRYRLMVSPGTISSALVGVLLFMLISNGMESSFMGGGVYQPMPLTSRSSAVSGSDSAAEANGCECLLELQCPRFSFHYPQQTSSVCKIAPFDVRATQSCLKWRERHLSTGKTHVVLIGDLRLLYLYHYIRDQVMSESERVQGPSYCRSLGQNWTHAYLLEEGSKEQPPQPCRFIAVSHLAKLEYIWIRDSEWTEALQEMLTRCRHGICPAMVVVSPRLDLALKSHLTHKDLLFGRTNIDVHRVVPLLERLRAHGVHAWWKVHENLLDMGQETDISAYDEVIQLQNMRVIKLLATSTVPVWTSANAIAWMHHYHCESEAGAPSALYLTADYRCHHPYHLGNWAYKQYVDIMLNFLCGKAMDVLANPCCAGWA